MNSEWSLDVLYQGYDDEQFKHDMEHLAKFVEEQDKFASTLTQPGNATILKEIVKRSEEYTILSCNLAYYLMLCESTNTTDSMTASLNVRLNDILSCTAKSDTIINHHIASIPNLMQIIDADPELKEYRYLFQTILENESHILNDDIEDIISKLNLSAGSQWSTMQQYLTSTVVVDYNNTTTTLSDIRNLAYDEDASIRKTAFEAELACYEKIKDPVSFSLNNIKSQVNTISELRGFSSPLSQSLYSAHMKQDTLDAMFTALNEYAPKFREYLKRKAEILGHKNGLPWYDLFAPVGSSELKFTLEEARDFLVSIFGEFSEDLKEMTERAFDEAWIDFYPRPGKVGGAFCENLPAQKQSRVLTNFNGTLDSVVTLAHELGHAYHGLQIETHKPLNWDYSMPVAETASTFNEAIVMNVLLKKASKQEKLYIIESTLRDITQTTLDIYSRYLFERTVFDRRKSEFLFADDLCEIMTKAQKTAYGDGLDPNVLNPYMWICKSHYYSEELSFYNYPYAFGSLFARGLYSKHQHEGAAFVPKYKEMLHATTVNSVEDTAKLVGIDLTNPDFWRQSLQSYVELIDEFIELTNQ